MNQHSCLAKYDFCGRVVVVTGAAGGIGRAICDLFAKNGATAVNWDREARDHDRLNHSLSFAVDITQPDSIDSALAATLAKFGRIDYLINNAGFAGSTSPLDEYDPEEWLRIVEVNLFGTYHVSRLVVPVMRRANVGRIVNIASLAGKERTPNASSYSVAKADVIALTKSLGKELAQTGIVVNGIAPAAVETSLLRKVAKPRSDDDR